MTDLKIRSETPADRDAIHTIVRDAFGQEAEALLVDRLRAAGDLVLSLVADQGGLVGHLAFSRMAVSHGGVVALAPLSVSPARQRQGIGTALVREGLRRLRNAGEDLVLVLGEPAFYGRFGFTPDAAKPLRTAYDGPYLQALALTERGQGVAGEATYAAAFAELG